jgi:uncharacterized membrane protein/regulator of replication initiation timing
VDFSAINLSNLPISSVLTEQLGNLIKQIPVEIPTMLHPPLVHFAIVLPVVIVLLEIFNIVAKMTSTAEAPRGKTVSALSFFLILLLVVVAIGAYATGSVDGKNTWDVLSEAGQADLKHHKLIGAYVVFASLILFVFKLISFIGTKTRVLFLILAIGFTALTLKQGKEGGELVYEHGANVQKVKELDDKLFDVQDELDTLKSDKNTTTKNASDLEVKVQAVETQKKALEAEVAALKTKLDETTKSLEAKATNALKEAEAKANATIEMIKADAAKAVEAAKAAVAPAPTPEPTPVTAGGAQAE